MIRIADGATATGKLALVTGGSGALGGAIAVALDRAGHSVVVQYCTHVDEAERVVRALNHRSASIEADVADWSSVRHMEESIREALGHVDIVVNSAAIRRDGLLAGQAVDEWRQVIEVNLLGSFHVTRAVLPEMLRRRWGRIVNVISPAGIRGNPGQTAYGASKAGVLGMTRALALECAKRGVTVNALSPGYMETAMTNDLTASAREAIQERIPVGRVTTPEEVAEAINFIVSSPYLTGQVISIDGGLTA